VLGHEIAGEVVEVGNGVERYKIGDRVFILHHVPCNNCYYCKNGHETACETLHTTNYFPGGFSEYIRIPEINVKRGTFLLPDEVSYEDATFIEPLACVVRGQNLAGLKAGQSVLILGSGISGLLHLMLAKKRNAGKIIVTDINKYRLEMAKKLGADLALDASEDVPQRVREINDGRLTDLVIVCTSAKSAFDQALKSADRGGRILCFAPTLPETTLNIPINEFWRNEMTVMTSYANSPEEAKAALELIRTKEVPVGKLITHRLTLSEASQGFRLVSEAKESIKVIIKP